MNHERKEPPDIDKVVDDEYISYEGTDKTNRKFTIDICCYNLRFRS